jgi:hypothetical protein
MMATAGPSLTASALWRRVPLLDGRQTAPLVRMAPHSEVIAAYRALLVPRPPAKPWWALARMWRRDA